MPLLPVHIATKQVLLPLSKKTIEIRPYTAADEKQLLLIDRKNHVEMGRAMVKLVADCSVGTDLTTIKQLPASDAMYLYMYLHAMSVGVEKKVKFTCKSTVDNPLFLAWKKAKEDGKIVQEVPPEEKTECGHDEDVLIDIGRIELPETDYPSTIVLDDGTTISVKLPTLDQQMKMEAEMVMRDKDGKPLKTQVSAKSYDYSLDMMVDCMDTVAQGQNVSVIADEPRPDVLAWIGKLSHLNFSKMGEWFQNIPKPTTVVEWECSECKSPHKMKLELGEHFFR